MKRWLIISSIGWIGLLNVATLAAQSLGAFVGLSVPDENVSELFPAQVEDVTHLWRLVEQGLSYGYHAQLRYWLALSDEVSFTATAALHRFEQLTTRLYNQGGQHVADLQTVLNIIPIGFGVEYTLFRKLVGIYVFGDVLYSYTFTSTEMLLYMSELPPVLPIDIEPAYNRVGAGGGVGIDLDVKLFLADVRLGIWASNLIGRSSDEPIKSVVSLSFGVVFGGK